VRRARLNSYEYGFRVPTYRGIAIVGQHQFGRERNVVCSSVTDVETNGDTTRKRLWSLTDTSGGASHT